MIIIQGIAKGLTGAVTKPVSGVLDLISSTSEGVKNVVVQDPDDLIKKERAKRVLYGYSQIIMPYNEIHSNIVLKVSELSKSISNIGNWCFLGGLCLSGYIFAAYEEGMLLLKTINGKLILDSTFSKGQIPSLKVCEVKKGIYFEMKDYKTVIPCKELEKKTILNLIIDNYK